MAEIVGRSGAWKGVCDALWEHDIFVHHPTEIDSLLRYLKDSREDMINQKRGKCARACLPVLREIAELKAQTGLLARVANTAKIAVCKLKMTRIRIEESAYIKTLDENIEVLRRIANSPELAGAKAELLVVEKLERLSNDFLVFHDLTLWSRRFIRFEGQPLQSAQVDHLVLGPPGVFVIETKRWSANTASSGETFNPYHQVARASYLCYDLLRTHCRNLRVRSIIANLGALPPRPEGAKGKVLEPAELVGYITYFKQPELDAEEISTVAHILKHIPHEGRPPRSKGRIGFRCV